MYNAQVIAAARDTAEQLQRALVSRKTIDQAIGIIRARSGGTEEEAFNRLRRISQTENIKLHEVARRILDEAVRRADARHHQS
ncbi:ANTAR domain-containing protein [Mycobacterium sp.]|uniref:ANTAR domain-containing protein n=1 Tax=Mycobacterium sp. TaxID=1785 RepID=UPI003D0CE044